MKISRIFFKTSSRPFTLTEKVTDKLFQKFQNFHYFYSELDQEGTHVSNILWVEVSLKSEVIGRMCSVGVLWVRFDCSWTMNGTFEEHLLKKYSKGGTQDLGFWDNGKQSSWFRTLFPYFRDIYSLYWFCLFIFWWFLGRIISTSKKLFGSQRRVPRTQN